MKINPFLQFILAGTLIVFFCCNRQQQTQQTQQPQQAQQTAKAQQAPPAQQQPQLPAPQEQTNATQEQHSESASANFRMPAFWENPDAAGVLAPTLDPAMVAPEAQAAYLIAQQKPKLLAQMPCFCYCDRFGHKSLHDCYVSTHAEHCDICIKEAIEADQMEKQGMTPEEIRSVLVAKHHPPS